MMSAESDLTNPIAVDPVSAASNSAALTESSSSIGMWWLHTHDRRLRLSVLISDVI
jgi:hypothetical protein